MFAQIKKIQNLTAKFDSLLLKGLGFMFVLILIAGINAANTPDRQPNQEGISSNKINNISYRNCIKSPGQKFMPPKDNLKTDITNNVIDLVAETDSAGYGKSGLPVLNDPSFINIKTAENCITSQANVYIVIYDNQIKIYPESILIHHQLINDTIGSTKIIIAYSPYSHSAAAFLAGSDTFDLSGRVYKGNNLIFDKKTESLWLQVNGKAVIGERTKQQLSQIVMQSATFKNAAAGFPEAQVISFETGYNIDYGANPYIIFENTSLPYGKIDTSNYTIAPKASGLTFILENKPYFFRVDQIGVQGISDAKFSISLNPVLEVYEPVLKNGGIIPFQSIYYYSYKEIFENSVL